MSSGLECEFVEVEPGQWWYLLQSHFASKNAWNWRDDADAYGPFDTFDAAHDHLGANHSNPGGYSVEEYVEGQGGPDKRMVRLMEEARERDREIASSGPFGYFR